MTLAIQDCLHHVHAQDSLDALRWALSFVLPSRLRDKY